MATGNGNVEMMVSVLPGTMTGFAALNAGLASINNSFLLMTSAISENFGLVDSAILSTGVVIAQVASDAVNAFADFEQSMKIVQLVSSQTAQDIQYLGQQANEFAVKYRTDIDQITEGLQVLGRAGLNTAQEQTQVLENGLSTAKIEGRELNSVLEELIQNTALLGGNLKSDNFGEDSAYVNNLLVATSLSAPINTHDISETLKYSGGIAAAAGANIETDEGKEVLTDYMASIAAFAQKGVKGSIAGTALRAFFNKPATQDSSVVEALASIRLKPEYLWEDDEQTMKPISEQIRIIQDAMDKMNVSTMDRLQLWSKIVGGKMGQQMMKLDSDDIKELTSDIKQAESANALANKSMQTFKATMNEIGQEGARTFRNFGSTLVYIFNPALQILKQITSILSNPIGTTALAFGILGFFKAFMSRAKLAIGGFAKGLRNVWNDYTGENRLSISQYRGDKQKTGGLSFIGRDVDGNPIFGTQEQAKKASSSKKSTGTTKSKTPTTQKDFMAQWTTSPTQKAWEDYQKGKLTADQFGFIKKTSSWSEASDIDAMVRRGMIPQHMYDDMKRGMKKQTFMNKYGDKGNLEFSLLHAEYQDSLEKANKSTKERTKAVRSASEARERMGQSRQGAWDRHKQRMSEQAAVEAEKNNTIVQNTRNTATQVLAEWNRMCTGLVQSLNAQYNRNTKMGEDDQKRMSAHMQQKLEESKKYNELKEKGKNVTVPVNPSHQKDLEALEKRKWALRDMHDEDMVRMNRHAMEKVEAHKNAPEPRKTVNRGDVSREEYYKMPQNIFKPDPYADEERNKQLNNLKKQDQDNLAQLYRMRAGQSDAVQGILKNPSHEGMTPAGAMIAMQQQILALKEQELLVEQEILNKKRQERLAQDDANRKALADFRKGFAYNDPEGKKKFDEELRKKREGIQAKKDASKYLRDSAKANAAAGEAAQEMQRKKDLLKSEMQNPNKTAINAAMSMYGTHGDFINKFDRDSKAKIDAIVKEHQGMIKRLSNTPGLGSNVMVPLMTPKTPEVTSFVDNLRNKTSGAMNTIGSKIKSFGSEFRSQFISYATRDRSGRALAFSNKGLGKLGNAALNLSDLIGGPVMVAMMLFTAAMDQVKKAYEEYHSKLQKLSEKVDEAYNKLNQAESALRETHSKEYPDADKDQINEMVYGTYKQISDDIENAFNNGMDKWIEKATPSATKLPEYEQDEEGELKEKEKEEQTYEEAVNENTKALYEAIFELQNATSKYVTQATDGMWGVDGLSTKISDTFGYITDNVLTSGGSSYEDKNEFLLTASQKDEKYPFSTEMAGLLIEDFKDAGGDWIKGLRTAMGKNADEFAQIIPKETREFWDNNAKTMSRMGAANSARLQTSMKRDKKTWQALAKEIAKEERKTGKSLGTKQTGNKKIEGLLYKLNTTMGNNFDRTQLLQAAYLQQAEDMYTVAQQVFTPLLQQSANYAGNIWAESMGINTGTGHTVGNTGGTVSVASSIAAMVAIIARQSAKGAFYDTALQFDPTKTDNPNYEQDKHLYELAKDSANADDFYKRVLNEYNEGLGIIDAGPVLTSLAEHFGIKDRIVIGDEKSLVKNNNKDYGANLFARLYEAQAKQVVYGYDAKEAWEKAGKDVEDMKKQGMSHQDMLTDIAKNYQEPSFLSAVEAAYETSGIGEDDEGGSGGGGSGGGDSGDKDKKTKKERVDLVLCNKKEIPKLNVNLFKKPPSFTVLNKNFKLRDIKVNTQDKPKAVLASIKNAIIDVQKRSDPKIIQDESAEYDPVGATDGTNVPSGSTNTGTD